MSRKVSNSILLDVAIEAALAASNSIMDSNKPKKNIFYKGPANLVTEVDIKSERIIKSIIQSNFKDHSIISEESDIIERESNYKWIIDPLDGTTNFVHGYPSYSVSIAIYNDDEPIIGVVLEMPNLKMYTAVIGKGAYCEGEKIKPSSVSDIGKSLFITGFGYNHDQNWENSMKLFRYFTDISHGVRRLGAASIDICHVASGKADGFWEFDLKPWDTAAGSIIAKEAGCLISDITGNDHTIFSNSILIANKYIYEDLFYRINNYLN